jgi:PAS domain S-box-containing protein
MSTRHSRSGTRVVPAVLFVAAIAASGTFVFAPQAIHQTAGLASMLTTAACLLASLVILGRANRPDAWRSARWLASGVLGFAVLSGALLYERLSGARLEPWAYDALFLAIAILFLIPIRDEFRDHLPKEDRREILADVLLASVAFATALFVFLQHPSMPASSIASLAVTALIVTTAVAAYASLALWVPSPAHVGLLVSVVGLFSGVLTLSVIWSNGGQPTAHGSVSLPILLGSLFLAFVVTVVPRAATSEHEAPPTRFGRPVLTTLSVAAACAALGLIASREVDHEVERVLGSGMIGLLALGIAVRIFVNQLRGSAATRAAHDALDQKEVALRETDRALARLQRANETLRESEERLRTVFESAVDGIVELGDQDLIVRANEAFCRMIELPRSLIEGQSWSALAASIEADEPFFTLPATGQGTLRREGNPIYLESRISEVPGDHPRRLLLVRDVTAAKIADQTIRNLFKFLQDRDEDRTRIMRRTHALIESERNRIARDLHDGPVQGVSAASLSLEAVLLMIRAGEMDEGLEVLAKVRRELSEEADNLRRLMSGLRPPLLEERGLIPALREILNRYGADNGVRTDFVGRATVEIPRDLETLAYRIVQEALSNSNKHAKAERVAVSVEAVAGQLRIEIADDGVGFDPGKVREFLRQGRVGLASMRERVELANGTFMVHSTPEKGTNVLATLPLEEVPAPRELAVNEA